jgi:4-diphosphocytidyl-2-C-methyl-D-erythritol kinase
MSLRAVHDLLAPAKLNLFLHVVGRRADGYHELQSVFTLIDWCDRLHLERRDDGRLARHDLGVPLPAEDLCLRAARVLQQASGCAWGVDIHIDKQLPAGAGMGGGSSDAATVLLGLNRLWQLHWPRARLAELALGLGADVPFFVGGRTAWVEGIGERLQALELPAAAYAVLKPTVSIPTAAIFGAADLVRDTPRAILAGFPDGHSPLFAQGPRVLASEIAAGFGRNDLQSVAMRVAPEVQQALAMLERSFGNSRMTGSGSAVFARIDANAVSSVAMPQDLPVGWVGRVCRGWSEHPLLGWADD